MAPPLYIVLLTVFFDSLSSWRYDLRKLKIWPCSHHVTLCWGRRFEVLFENNTNSWSETRFEELFEHRLRVPLIVFEVIASVFSNFLENMMRIKVDDPTSNFTSTRFSKNLKAWPQKQSMAFLIYAQRAFQPMSQVNCWCCGRREPHIVALNKGWQRGKVVEFGACGGHSFTRSTSSKKLSVRSM